MLFIWIQAIDDSNLFLQPLRGIIMKKNTTTNVASKQFKTKFNC